MKMLVISLNGISQSLYRRITNFIHPLLTFIFLLFYITLIYADCPPIYVPLNGKLIGQWENQCKTTEGAVCRVVCNYNYKLVGDFERVCSNGQWSGYEAYCVDTTIRCPQTLRAPANGFAIGLCQPYAGYTCKFSCAQGYTLSNPSPITCLTSGVWSNSQPTCELNTRSSCSTAMLLSGFKGGQSSCTSLSIVETGGVCSFVCDVGYVLTGNTLVTCMSNGKWSGQSPLCKSILGDRFDFENGIPGGFGSGLSGNDLNGVMGSSGNSLGEGFNLGTTSGNNNININWPSNGNPSLSVASNTLKRCRSPYKPRNGAVTCECPVSPPRSGCSCSFTCSEGYQLVGFPTIYCKNNGEWTSREPFCKRGRGCRLKRNINPRVVFLYCNTLTHGRCHYRCRGSVFTVNKYGEIEYNLNPSILSTGIRVAGNMNANSFDMEYGGISGKVGERNQPSFGSSNVFEDNNAIITNQAVGPASSGPYLGTYLTASSTNTLNNVSTLIRQSRKFKPFEGTFDFTMRTAVCGSTGLWSPNFSCAHLLAPSTMPLGMMGTYPPALSVNVNVVKNRPVRPIQRPWWQLG